MKLLPALLCSLLVTTVPLRAGEPWTSGFEENPSGWSFNEQPSMSTVTAGAAHEGKAGLHISDESSNAGSSALSGKIPVTPSSELELTFQARTNTPGFVGVYLWFFDSAGKLIKEESQRAGQGHPVTGVSKADGQWNSYRLTAHTPENAETVAVWIHSFGQATGSADFDDFVLSGVSSPEAAVAPTPPPVALPNRAKPPLIVIKVDDFRPVDGKVHPLWQKLADYLTTRKIPFSIGVLMDKTSEASPVYFDWVRRHHAAGDIEFWLHGWDHATHVVDGVTYNEFNHRSFDEQKKRFDDSQTLAKEKFGFAFTTFGPPGGAANGAFDDNTIRVMAEDPAMRVWLYPQPLDRKGADLAAAGKVTILDRVWPVNLESRVGQPDFQKFLEGYAKYPDREYFVLQGHPMSWGSTEKFEQFKKIIDFLVAQNAKFVTPSELAQQLKATGHQ
ncbi:hypothetical protein BH09VER1_BH09VER1_43000 [soil metagenome]